MTTCRSFDMVVLGEQGKPSFATVVKVMHVLD